MLNDVIRTVFSSLRLFNCALLVHIDDAMISKPISGDVDAKFDFFTLLNYSLMTDRRPVGARCTISSV